MIPKLQITVDLEKDKDFINQIENSVTYQITRMFEKEKIEKTVAGALNYYFGNWGRSTVEEVVKKAINELIVSAIGDKSSLPAEKKAEIIILQLVREAVNDIVREKLKNVEIKI
jgi:hypothetical protein